jgi:glycolate oxidase
MNVAAALRTVLPDGLVVDDPDVLAAYRHDEAGFVAAGTPAAVVRARSSDEVAAVLRLASERGIPVVPRGAGSGLSGGANAIDGCIVLSLELMDAIVEVSAEDLVAVVQPGVLNADLTAAVREHGLAYPPDPASAEFSTIGGNIATNAGGLCCVKYGVTGDYVMGLEVVLADASVVRTGRRTLKGVAGYDLTHLFVGSEGTLGVVTEATLRLRPAAAEPCTLVAFFPTVHAAAVAATTAGQAGVIPAMLEMMDRATITAVDDATRMGLDRDAAALLVAQSDAGEEHGEREMDVLARCCEEAGATFLARSTDPDEAEQLTRARREALPSLERLGDVLLDDVGVPRSRIPALVVTVEEIAASTGVRVATFGHIGDGNMHPTIVYDRSDADETERAYAAFERIIRAAIALGGTITGEHGVGILKRPFLRDEVSATAIDLHRAIKHTLDPLGILNPGKVLDTDTGGQPLIPRA